VGAFVSVTNTSLRPFGEPGKQGFVRKRTHPHSGNVNLLSIHVWGWQLICAQEESAWNPNKCTFCNFAPFCPVLSFCNFVLPSPDSSNIAPPVCFMPCPVSPEAKAPRSTGPCPGRQVQVQRSRARSKSPSPMNFPQPAETRSKSPKVQISGLRMSKSPSPIKNIRAWMSMGNRQTLE
jgi:hypothetical protein